MTFSTTASKCHACRTPFLTGCVRKHVCADCKAKGHDDALGCRKCESESQEGIIDGLLKQLEEQKKILLLGREVGKGFSGRGGAIIHHDPQCVFYQMLLRGERPANDNACDCKAKATGKKLLEFMKATKDLEGQDSSESRDAK